MFTPSWLRHDMTPFLWSATWIDTKLLNVLSHVRISILDILDVFSPFLLVEAPYVCWLNHVKPNHVESEKSSHGISCLSQIHELHPMMENHGSLIYTRWIEIP